MFFYIQGEVYREVGGQKDAVEPSLRARNKKDEEEERRPIL